LTSTERILLLKFSRLVSFFWSTKVTELTRALLTGPLRVSFEITTDLTSTSKLKQVVSLNSVTPRLDFSCEVDWNESHKFLKVEFPVAVRAMHATYEIQFGHWQRPTHWNTSWDVAKFEVNAVTHSTLKFC
jgi:alpha-mannosidase